MRVLQDSNYDRSRAKLTSAVKWESPPSTGFPFTSRGKDAIS